MRGEAAGVGEVVKQPEKYFCPLRNEYFLFLLFDFVRKCTLSCWCQVIYGNCVKDSADVKWDGNLRSLPHHQNHQDTTSQSAYFQLETQGPVCVKWDGVTAAWDYTMNIHTCIYCYVWLSVAQYSRELMLHWHPTAVSFLAESPAVRWSWERSLFIWGNWLWQWRKFDLMSVHSLIHSFLLIVCYLSTKRGCMIYTEYEQCCCSDLGVNSVAYSRCQIEKPI